MDTNREYDEVTYMSGMRKIMYLQKYGVKSFPYHGRRRYTPSISQSLDGGIVISNDVFGMTIRQFERIYKDCLERRKTREQWILNLRYPDKSSNEYMEYLQNCTDLNNDNLIGPGIDLKRNNLYDHLVHVVGTEIIVRNRQRLCIIKDMIDNLLVPGMIQISSGSLAEGLDLPGSDLDVMFLINDVDVIQSVWCMRHSIRKTTVVMESDNDHPGFTRLRLVAGGEDDSGILTSECFESTTNGLYFSAEEFLNTIKQKLVGHQVHVHGPSLTNTNQNFDFAFCLRSKSLPYSSISWVRRHRHQWPPNFVIDKIKKYGWLLVPIGPKNMLENRLLWRLSFSMAEKQLVHSFNFTQILCYGLLKLTLKRIINTNDDVKDLLCSYFLKTALFWVSEEEDIEIFQIVRLFYCFSLCLDKIILWINNCYCPNYFIPKYNMFLGKVDQSNNKKLRSVLENIKCGGMDGLINNLFPNESVRVNHRLLSTKGTSFIVLDFYFYRICGFIRPVRNIFCYYKLLQFVKSLQKSESSKFIIDSCKYYSGSLSQYAVQWLPPPTMINKASNIQRIYHIHLHDGIRTNAVSGWLLYASYYYVTGQYNVTLRLTEYVLSRCKHDMVNISCDIYEAEHMHCYKQNVQSEIILQNRMKLATIDGVTYVRHSSLIPEELQVEVEEMGMFIPPVVLSYCLRFLCYHHIGNIYNRQQALYDLFLTVKDRYFVPVDGVSGSKTILGVCYEISGDKTNAYQCYDDALEDDEYVCRSAKVRKSILLLALTYTLSIN
ncbi:unnamed protein product [Mytilus coruscus]|uniref:Uncharacterized protein n=1 Tax=Mytilus coruscus TaxID=42192 RepID=A0A6J8C5R4_MYTCO|nr:unnamed protein product [Mytilus coruscus]